MKTLILGVLFSAALVGCSDKQEITAKPAAEKQPAGNVSAGKAIAERDCKVCHGLDGKGVAPGIPHLAAQRERYLLGSMKEYKDGKRSHAALKDKMAQMSDADARSVAAYFASLPPVVATAAIDVKHSSLYEKGKALASACTKCHGEDGNSKTPGTPSLAGQQPHYLVAAIQEYHQGERKTATMKSMLRESNKTDLENLAVYFAAQTPVQRPAPASGDPAAGEPLSAMCGGCHGSHGVSADAATPSLAGQDARYLVKSIKAYRTTRQHWGMQRYVAGLSDKDMENIAAFYVVQKPQAADKVPASTQELADKCNRCHDSDNNPAMAPPKMRGQDKDYLVMALRAYRDGKRESSTMHNMSTIYSNAIIESISTWYASQAPK
ncbi:MAG: cytochrome c4 [Betaproteobacteria bacterium]|nr:cytochrome c4 [Betaproteobacteria bacterium]MBI2959162.1 cytochrome c4 [Betaproteobacteria bacterium]